MWLADAAGPPLSGLGYYGLAGLVLSVLLWFAWRVINRAWDKQDAAEVEVKRLNQLIQDKYVPSLEESSRALKESASALAVAKAQRRS